MSFPTGFNDAIGSISGGGGGSPTEGCVTADSTCYPGYSSYANYIGSSKNLLELGSGPDVLGDKITLDTQLSYLEEMGVMIVGTPDDLLLFSGSLSNPSKNSTVSTGWMYDIEGLPSTTLEFNLIGNLPREYGASPPIESGANYQIDGKVDFVPCLTHYLYGSYTPICRPMEGFITQDFSTTAQANNNGILKFTVSTPVFPSCTVRAYYYTSITANVGVGVAGIVYATRIKKIV